MTQGKLNRAELYKELYDIVEKEVEQVLTILSSRVPVIDLDAQPRRGNDTLRDWQSWVDEISRNLMAGWCDCEAHKPIPSTGELRNPPVECKNPDHHKTVGDLANSAKTLTPLVRQAVRGNKSFNNFMTGAFLKSMLYGYVWEAYGILIGPAQFKVCHNCHSEKVEAARKGTPIVLRSLRPTPKEKPFGLFQGSRCPNCHQVHQLEHYKHVRKNWLIVTALYHNIAAYDLEKRFHCAMCDNLYDLPGQLDLIYNFTNLHNEIPEYIEPGSLGKKLLTNILQHEVDQSLAALDEAFLNHDRAEREEGQGEYNEQRQAIKADAVRKRQRIESTTGAIELTGVAQELKLLEPADYAEFLWLVNDLARVEREINQPALATPPGQPDQAFQQSFGAFFRRLLHSPFSPRLGLECPICMHSVPQNSTNVWVQNTRHYAILFSTLTSDQAGGAERELDLEDKLAQMELLWIEEEQDADED